MAGRVIHYVKSQYVDGLPDPAAVKLLAAEHVDWAGGPLPDTLSPLLRHAASQ